MIRSALGVIHTTRSRARHTTSLLSHCRNTHAERIEGLRQRNERFQIDGRHGQSRVPRLGGFIVIAKQRDRLLREYHGLRTARRFPYRRRVLDRRGHDLLPALQELRVRPVKQRASPRDAPGWMPTSSSSKPRSS